jgi:hypothetical protein
MPGQTWLDYLTKIAAHHRRKAAAHGRGDPRGLTPSEFLGFRWHCLL